MQPALVLADEPTGNLDTHSADDVFALMRDINVAQQTTFLIVTHDPRLAARCDRRIELVELVTGASFFEQATQHPCRFFVNVNTLSQHIGGELVVARMRPTSNLTVRLCRQIQLMSKLTFVSNKSDINGKKQNANR
jgi:ABC-type cobalamin/Fe3+-siderophores transport system ATPase subunit